MAPPYRCPQERRGRWVQINFEYKNGVGKTNTKHIVNASSLITIHHPPPSVITHQHPSSPSSSSSSSSSSHHHHHPSSSIIHHPKGLELRAGYFYSGMAAGAAWSLLSTPSTVAICCTSFARAVAVAAWPLLAAWPLTFIAAGPLLAAWPLTFLAAGPLTHLRHGRCTKQHSRCPERQGR